MQQRETPAVHHGDSPAACSDLAAGTAAEHLVCADLLLAGYRAFFAAQICPYDVAVEVGGLIRIQVKSTRVLRPMPQRVTPVTAYLFYTRKAGKGGKRVYQVGDFDMFALVALDIRVIAYIPAHKIIRQTIQLKPPGAREWKGRKLPGIDKYPFCSALAELQHG